MNTVLPEIKDPRKQNSKNVLPINGYEAASALATLAGGPFR